MSFSIGLVNTIIILVGLALSPLIAHFIAVDYILMRFFFFFFFFNFKNIVSTPDDNSLSLNQDINQFFVYMGIESKSFMQPSETLLVELTRTHTNALLV